jgi:hypothetical protein
MNRTTKNVQGQLLGKSGRNLLSEARVTITLIDPQRQDERPTYEVSLIVDGYKPELDNKSHLLKLSDDLIGQVFISISIHEIPGLQTSFKVFLQDSIWNNLEWFKKI